MSGFMYTNCGMLDLTIIFSWKEVLDEAEKRLGDGQLLEDDGGVRWDIDSLRAYEEGIEGFVVDGGNYYCVAFDGAIGVTRDDGYNVDWLYTVVE